MDYHERRTMYFLNKRVEYVDIVMLIAIERICETKIKIAWKNVESITIANTAAIIYISSVYHVILFHFSNISLFIYY